MTTDYSKVCDIYKYNADGSFPQVPERFLNAFNGNEKKAKKRWEKTVKWRKKFKVDEIKEIDGKTVTQSNILNLPNVNFNKRQVIYCTKIFSSNTITTSFCSINFNHVNTPQVPFHNRQLYPILVEYICYYALRFLTFFLLFFSNSSINLFIYSWVHSLTLISSLNLPSFFPVSCSCCSTVVSNKFVCSILDM